jgi:hypothetical protein
LYEATTYSVPQPETGTHVIPSEVYGARERKLTTRSASFDQMWIVLSESAMPLDSNIKLVGTSVGENSARVWFAVIAYGTGGRWPYCTYAVVLRGEEMKIAKKYVVPESERL